MLLPELDDVVDRNVLRPGFRCVARWARGRRRLLRGAGGACGLALLGDGRWLSQVVAVGVLLHRITLQRADHVAGARTRGRCSRRRVGVDARTRVETAEKQPAVVGDLECQRRAYPALTVQSAENGVQLGVCIRQQRSAVAQHPTVSLEMVQR